MLAKCEQFCVSSCNQLQFGNSSSAASGLPQDVADLLRHSIAPNSERAYRSDLQHFRAWGGVIPATPASICDYIATHSGTLSVATIRRRVFTVSKAHEC